MQITVEASIPIDRTDPGSFIEPVLPKVFALDDDGSEWLVGQLYADMIFVGLAQLHGHRMIDVLDCGAWEASESDEAWVTDKVSSFEDERWYLN